MGERTNLSLRKAIKGYESCIIILPCNCCHRVQPYLKKCFAGVENLRLNEDGDITCLMSDLGEELNLTEIVDTGSKRGQVEKWLADLEGAMKTSVMQVNQLGIALDRHCKRLLY